ncbi:MAG: hypothetical protein ACI4EL_09540 [Candidatus Fimimorpha sp.]
MNRLIKRLLSIVIASSMVLVSSTIAFASEISSNEYGAEMYSPYAVKTYLSASSYFDGKMTELEKNDSKISVWLKNDRVYLEITSNLIAAGEKQTFSGEVFAIHGNGYYDSKLVLGDFDKSGKFNIAQFKILTERQPVLTILIEDLDTGKLVEFTSQISQSLFTGLMQIAKANTAMLESKVDRKIDLLPRTAVAQKVIELMQPSKRFLYGANRRSFQSNSTFKSTSSYSGASATATTLKNFCTSVNNSASSGVTPNSTMQTILTQTGWKMYKTSSHFYVMHGVTNSSTEQLVGITVASLSNYRPTSTKISASYTIIGSCTLSYNTVTHVATLLQYDTGIRLEDATIAIELVNGSAYFYEATKTWNLDSSGTGVKDILVAISSELGIASAIWDALKTSNDSSPTIDFGSYSNQVNVYGGPVRAVANQTASGKYLWGKDNSLGVIGLHYNSSTYSYSSHRIAWGFTGYSLL